MPSNSWRDLATCAACLSCAGVLWIYLRGTSLSRLGGKLAILLSAVGVALLRGPWWSEDGSRLVLVLASVGLLRQLPRLPIGRVSRRIDEEDEAQAIVDRAVVAASLTRDDGTLLAVNPAGSRMLGHPLEEIDGFRWERSVHPDDRDENARWVRNYCAKRTRRLSFRFKWLHPARGTIALSAHPERLPDGKILWYLTDESLEVARESLENV